MDEMQQEAQLHETLQQLLQNAKKEKRIASNHLTNFASKTVTEKAENMPPVSR